MRLANVDATLNGRGNWNANLLAFAAYPRRLGDLEVAAAYAHFSSALLQFDPEHLRLAGLLADAAKARSCPFDPATCGACGGVKDWSAAADSVVTQGTECLRAIDRFCSANPQHPRCTCWDLANPEYGGTGCTYYRTVFNGAPIVVEAPKPAVPAPVLPPPVVPPPPSSCPESCSGGSGSGGSCPSSRRRHESCGRCDDRDEDDEDDGRCKESHRQHRRKRDPDPPKKCDAPDDSEREKEKEQDPIVFQRAPDEDGDAYAPAVPAPKSWWSSLFS